MKKKRRSSSIWRKEKHFLQAKKKTSGIEKDKTKIIIVKKDKRIITKDRKNNYFNRLTKEN